MGESVEQAALRRAAHDDLPAPFGAIMQAIAAAGDLCDARHRQTTMLVEQVDALHAENAELRDGLLALSNRIEAVSRGWKPRREEARCRYCDRTRTFTEGKCDVCDGTIVGVGRPL